MTHTYHIRVIKDYANALLKHLKDEGAIEDLQTDADDDDNTYQFTDVQKADLDKHAALRKAGLASYTPWEEVRANAIKKLNERRNNNG